MVILLASPVTLTASCFTNEVLQSTLEQALLSHVVEAMPFNNHTAPTEEQLCVTPQDKLIFILTSLRHIKFSFIPPKMPLNPRL